MDLKEWLEEGKNVEMHPFVTKDDSGKEAVIESVRLGETRFGTKLFIDLRIGEEMKTLVLGKSLARKLAEKLGNNQEEWIGKSGKIMNVLVNVPKVGMKERPMFIPSDI